MAGTRIHRQLPSNRYMQMRQIEKKAILCVIYTRMKQTRKKVQEDNLYIDSLLPAAMLEMTDSGGRALQVGDGCG